MRTQRHRSSQTRRGLVLVCILVLLTSACRSTTSSNTASRGTTIGQKPTTQAAPTETPPPPTTQTAPTETPPTPAVQRTPTPYPNAIAGLIGGPPSQRETDAQQDGVHSSIAWLSFADRVEIQAEVNVRGQRWVLSRFPAATRPIVPTLGEHDSSLDPGSSELLLLDGETILRSIPMVSSPATWIASVDATIYAGRIGDGGYPDDTLIRFDTETGALDRLWVPWAYNPQVAFPSYRWDMVAPSSASALRDRISPIANGDTSAGAIRALDQAIADTVTFNPYEMPVLALSRSSCTIGDAEHYYDYGTHCVVEEGSRITGDTSVFIIGERVPGMLVGAGWLEASGPTYAAIVDAPGQFSESGPLLFVDINDPSKIWDTGLVGVGPAFSILKVSFFEGGFVTTAAVDLGVQVRAYDVNAEPIAGFVSPTARELGYPPDPAVGHAAGSPDGTQLAYVERRWPLDGLGLPGEDAAIVVRGSDGSDEVLRIPFTLDRHEQVRVVDFDGRWITASFERFGSAASTASIPARQPVMIDTTSGEVFPLGFDQPSSVTIERRTAPDEPPLRLMTPGPYRHGQTVTLRQIPRPLHFQHGERLPDWIGGARLCAGKEQDATCADLAVTRRTAATEIPVEIDVQVSALVGHRTQGDIESDTTHDCRADGCLLAGIAVEFEAGAVIAMPTMTITIAGDVAEVDIAAALFGRAQVGICFTPGSTSEARHRSTTVRVPFCTDFEWVDFVDGAASIDLVLREDLATACAIDECTTRLFYEAG